MYIERYVLHNDLGKAGGERLLAWCRLNGSDSFTVSAIGSEPELSVAGAAFDQRLMSFAIDPRRIRAIDPPAPGSYWTHPTQLWELNDASAAILLECFPRGLLTYYPENAVWFEDPCLYRGAELMLGAISHEAEAVLRLESSEQLTLDQSKIPYRLKGEWIAY